MESQEAALKQSIALKQIRAEQDGVMGPVYRQEGELLKAGDVLAVVHSTEKNVAAVCRSSVVSRIGTGAEAAILDSAGQFVGQASLTAIGVPETDTSTGQSVQRLVFEPETTLTAEPGQRCVVELVQEKPPERSAGSAGSSGRRRLSVAGGKRHGEPLSAGGAGLRRADGAGAGGTAGQKRGAGPGGKPPDARVPGEGGARLLKWREQWRFSFRNLFAAPMRSLLTVLGCPLGLEPFWRCCTLGTRDAIRFGGDDPVWASTPGYG